MNLRMFSQEKFFNTWLTCSSCVSFDPANHLRKLSGSLGSKCSRFGWRWQRHIHPCRIHPANACYMNTTPPFASTTVSISFQAMVLSLLHGVQRWQRPRLTFSNVMNRDKEEVFSQQFVAINFTSFGPVGIVVHCRYAQSNCWKRSEKSQVRDCKPCIQVVRMHKHIATYHADLCHSKLGEGQQTSPGLLAESTNAERHPTIPNWWLQIWTGEQSGKPFWGQSIKTMIITRQSLLCVRACMHACVHACVSVHACVGMVHKPALCRDFGATWNRATNNICSYWGVRAAEGRSRGEEKENPKQQAALEKSGKVKKCVHYNLLSAKKSLENDKREIDKLRKQQKASITTLNLLQVELRSVRKHSSAASAGKQAELHLNISFRRKYLGS